MQKWQERDEESTDEDCEEGEKQEHMKAQDPRHSMYVIFAYIGMVSEINVGIYHIYILWSVWVIETNNNTQT